jgi:hypothetical protein
MLVNSTKLAMLLSTLYVNSLNTNRGLSNVLQQEVITECSR